MTTSATTSFNPDIGEICEEAFERCGLHMRTGYDLRTARRSLNFLFIELSTIGLNLWQLEEVVLPLISGTAEYTLPVDTVDIMDATIRTGTLTAQQDISITRLGFSQYSNVPNKNSTGRPTNYFVDRQVSGPSVTVWPVPNNSSFSLVYWRIRRIQDAGSSGGYTMDIPSHFIPAVVAGLAFHLATKRVQDVQKKAELKQSYMDAVANSGSEDRDRSSFFITPDMS